MTTTRLTAAAIALAGLCAASLTAQTQETQTTTKTKIEIKGGKDVTVSGCLERRPGGDYVLTSVRDKGRLEYSRYALVTSQDLSEHVGERVEIKGKAVTNGDGKVWNRVQDENRSRKRQRSRDEDQERRHERRVRPAVPRCALDEDTFVFVQLAHETV